MDHHILPQIPTTLDIEVPYVCSPPRDGIYTPYDGGPFPKYPERLGKAWLLPSGVSGVSPTASHMERRHNFNSAREQESTYQAWLFFGLLSTFMGSAYNAQDYIDESGFVTTRCLTERMKESWQSRGASASAEEQERQFTHANFCLREVGVQLNSCRPDFDWRIRLSITSVAELFGRAVNLAYTDVKLKAAKLAPVSYFPEFPNSDMCPGMLKAGWCPSEISSISSRFRSLQTKVFLSRLDKSGTGRVHDRCSENECRLYRIDRKTYKTAHAEVGCDCDPIQVDDAILRTILSTDSLPVLEISSFTQRTPVTKIVPSKEIPSFVAISHVWADGLGDQTANKLPGCQIAELGKLVKAFQDKMALEKSHSATSNETNPSSARADIAYVWIDTICCPWKEGDAKNIALRRMRETYSDASQVLVLDKALREMNFKSLRPIEALLCIFNSAWMQRLWTLQEGYLPKELWIQFCDEAVNLDKLYKGMLPTRHTDLRIMSILEDVGDCWRGMRPLHESELTERNTNLGIRLFNLDQALLCRNVSNPEDEPLIIANLLNLAPDWHDELTNTTNDVESRMVVVWQTLAQGQGLPQNMIMLDYPRLQTKGFRWAPRTLLQPPLGSRVLQWRDTVMGQVDARGFKVRYSGVRLDLEPRACASTTSATGPKKVDLRVPISFKVDGQRYVLVLKNGLEVARSSYTDIPDHASLFSQPLAVLQVNLVDTSPESRAEHEVVLVTRIDAAAAADDSTDEIEIVCPAMLIKRNEAYTALFDAVDASIERICAGQPPSDRAERREPEEDVVVWDDVQLPLPAHVCAHADDLLLERPALKVALGKLYNTDIRARVIGMLAWTTWASLAYTSKAETVTQREWRVR